MAATCTFTSLQLIAIAVDIYYLLACCLFSVAAGYMLQSPGPAVNPHLETHVK